MTFRKETLLKFMNSLEFDIADIMCMGHEEV